MEKLIVAGAGGFGRELMSWARDCVEAGRLPPLAGFIDDRVMELPGGDAPRLGGFADYAPRPNELFLIGVGDPTAKRRMAESLRDRGARFATLIHPTAVIGRNTKRGEGVIMCPMTMNTSDTCAGDFVTILSFSGMGHDTTVGAFSTISSHVDVMGYAELGEEVFVGSGARVMPRVKVSDRARIGANSLVMRNVKPGATVFTPPAKLLRLGKD